MLISVGEPSAAVFSALSFNSLFEMHSITPDAKACQGLG